MSTEVTLRGRLGGDPELRFSKNGKPVTTFSVVTSRRFKNEQSGEWEDRDATWWNVVAFGQLAENVAESLTKGCAVIVYGNAYLEPWEAKDGTKRTSLKVLAEEVAPSMRWASVKVMKAERRDAPQARNEDPWSGDEPPF